MFINIDIDYNLVCLFDRSGDFWQFARKNRKIPKLSKIKPIDEQY